MLLEKKKVVNFGKEINIHNKSRDEIESEINKYLIINNVGKYLIFSDDTGEKQIDEYIVYKIINEDPKNVHPLVTIKKFGTNVFLYGGQNKKTCYTKRRSKSKNKSKNSYKLIKKNIYIKTNKLRSKK